MPNRTVSDRVTSEPACNGEHPAVVATSSARSRVANLVVTAMAALLVIISTGNEAKAQVAGFTSPSLHVTPQLALPQLELAAVSNTHVSFGVTADGSSHTNLSEAPPPGYGIAPIVLGSILTLVGAAALIFLDDWSPDNRVLGGCFIGLGQLGIGGGIWELIAGRDSSSSR